MEIENKEKYDSYRVYKTCIEMLNDRNYNTSNFDINLSYNDFLKIEDINIFTTHNNTNEEIYIKIFDERTSIGIPEINKMIEAIKKDYGENIHIIIVIRNSKIINFSRIKYSNVEIFKMSFLIINITKHRYVPKHEPLTLDEQKIFLNNNKNITLNTLPKIIVAEDPIARYFNLKEGQICRIYRNNPNTGKYITYRVGV